MIKTSEMTPEMLKELAFTQEEIDELNRSRKMPITFDEDCPETPGYNPYEGSWEHR